MRAESTGQMSSADIQASLRGMGFPEDKILLAITEGCDSVMKAVDFITTRPQATVKAGSASSSSNVGARPGGSAAGATASSAAIDVDANDPELQRALVESKAEARDAKNGKGDSDLELAIAASLKDSGPPRVSWPDEIGTQPERRVRLSMSTPVGLRNIGNTCYLNSLLQVYFHLPGFRRAVLSYRVPAADKPDAAAPVAPIVTSIDSPAVSRTDKEAKAARERERVAHAREFMVELQRLFAQMALGNQSIVDPSKLVRAMRDADGKQIEIGAQQDAAEFNEIFLELVQLAVVPEKERADGKQGEAGSGTPAASGAGASASGKGDDFNFVRSLFNTNFKQEVVHAAAAAAATSSTSIAQDDSDVQKSAVIDGKTTSFFVDATTAENRELYHGLDEYAQARIEYRFDAPEEVPQNNHLAAGISPKDDPMCISTSNDSCDKMKIDSATDGTTVVEIVSNLAKPAVKSEWFTNLAPVLTIYLKRVKYNRETKLAEKVHEKYLFDTEIAMDRYLDKNRVESERARKKVAKIQQQRRETEEKLNGIVYFPGTKPLRSRTSGESERSRSSSVRPVMIGPLEQKDAMAISQPMDTASPSQGNQDVGNDYFGALDGIKKRLVAARDSKSPYYVDKLSRSSVADALKVLETLETEDRFTKTSLKERVDALTIEESKCYEKLNSVKYQLWAVLVHDGAPASGHYLVFIRSSSQDGSKSRWMRFSDVSMTYVSEEEMLLWSVGGHGYASAYCLMYASSSQIPNAQSQPFEPEGEKFVEQCQRLLPKERLEEVNLLSSAFEQELLEYRLKVQRNKVQAKARSIVEMATAELRAAGMNENAMKEQGRSADAVPTGGPALRIRSIAEFCLTAKFKYNAIGHSLKTAWATHAADGSNSNIFDVARKYNESQFAFPPLPGSSAPENTLSADLDLLVLHEVFSIMRTQKISPALGSGDNPFLNLAEARQIPDVMVKNLSTLEERMGKSAIMYRFALRSTGLATCALGASFHGSWEAALWLWHHLGDPHHVLGPQDDRASLIPIIEEFFGMHRERDPFRFARHDELMRSVLPTIVVAASDDAAERIGFGIAEGHKAAIFVAEHVLRIYFQRNELVKILLQDWKNYFAGWRNGQSPFRDAAMRTAETVIDILTSKAPRPSVGNIVPISAEVQSRMEEACHNSAATAFGFKKLREQVYALGLIATDGPSVRRAAQQLRHHAADFAER